MKNKFLGQYWFSKAIVFWAVLGLVLSLSLGWMTVVSPPVMAQDAIAEEMAYLEETGNRWNERPRRKRTGYQTALFVSDTYAPRGGESTLYEIEVNLSSRELTALEGSTTVYSTLISSGTDADPTYEGVFAIQSMYDVTAMSGEAADGTPYEVDDVPFVLYYDGNYAIHGAYWHSAFGEFITHGCINVDVDSAGWLYDWASVGIPVIVHW